MERSCGNSNRWVAFRTRAKWLEQNRERGVLRFDQFPVRTKVDHDILLEVIATLYSEGDRQAVQLNMRDVSE